MKGTSNKKSVIKQRLNLELTKGFIQSIEYNIQFKNIYVYLTFETKKARHFMQSGLSFQITSSTLKKSLFIYRIKNTGQNSTESAE